MHTRPPDEEFVMPSLRLDDRVALVTGGGRGLGRGIAVALAHAGADVALAARTRAELDAAVAQVEALGRRALAIDVDLSEISSASRVVERVVEHFGKLDILVNGVGMNIRQPIDTFTEADWDRLMTVNLKSVFFLSQEAARVMRPRRKGRIINVGSIAFDLAIPNTALYAMSKGGIRAMTRNCALEWARDGVTVNAIAPGRFWTKLTDAVFSEPTLYDNAVGVIPMGRPGLPADLAGAALLLASDASDYITGQTIVVDGGWMISGGVKA